MYVSMMGCYLPFVVVSPTVEDVDVSVVSLLNVDGSKVNAKQDMK